MGPLAVKYLKKGITFKDNTIYMPLKKHVLQGEVEILRALNGECYNLKLVSVYESPSMIYMITEYCEGGMLVPWVSTAFKDTSGLRTEDVSRICYQLWSAVNHCAKHNVIHRDIKPENVMFCTTERDSELRLIDFGSGTIDGIENPQTSESNNSESNNNEVDRHHTFAGSAFYISPEMFQRTYTSKTDVWSAGATLYVLVAGYPADRLQESFNILQGREEGRLKKLPNLPDNMPESFYEMLEGALVYRHKHRMDAGQLKESEFAQFHIQHKQLEQGSKPGTISIHEIAAEAAGEFSDKVPEMANPSQSRTSSVLLEGSVRRHSAYLGYQKFERSVTAALATMLSKDTCKRLLLLLREQHKTGQHAKNEGSESRVGSTTEGTEADRQESPGLDTSGGKRTKANAEKLQVVTIKVLLELLGGIDVEDDREVKEVIAMIEGMKNFHMYENFAYHISLLRQFVSIHTRNSRGRGKVSDSDDESQNNIIRSRE